MTFSHVVQVGGSVLLLIAFVFFLAGWLKPKAMPYLVLNTAGSTVLALNAVAERQPGIVLLEGTWALASLAGLTRELVRGLRQRRRREVSAVPDERAVAPEETFCVWWEPPEIVGADEFPDGMWVVAEQYDPAEPPIYGDSLVDGPIDATVDWLATRCGCPAAAFTREKDFDIGLYARRPDGSMDYDRVERWITCPRYTVAAVVDRMAGAHLAADDAAVTPAAGGES
jgi:hypothetical protein